MSVSIDVVIPTFNRSQTLLRAVESVLQQSYRYFNLYVVNDGSTDNTDAAMSPYLKLPRFHYLMQENKGVSAARNLGVKHSSSEWIAFLDSDDEWLSSKLDRQVEFILAHPEYRMVHSDEMWIRNGVRVNPKAKFDKSSANLFERSLETCLVSPSTVVMQRQLLKEHGNFDESFKICEDYDLWLKILAEEEIGFIDEHLIKKYGGHEDQLSTQFKAMDDWRIRSLVRLVKSPKLTEEKRKWIRTQIDKKASLLLAGYLKHNQLERHEQLTKLLTT